MMNSDQFHHALAATIQLYRATVAGPDEHLALLGWQLAQGHRLDERTTLPGHLTTSAVVLSPDHSQVLLIDHITLKRWLQPGGHYEPSGQFHQSAMREAVEETGVADLRLHPWHAGRNLPIAIDSHEVPGKASRHEQPHIHHDLQFLFVADPALALVPQLDEVHAVRWHDSAALADISPRAAARLRSIVPPQGP